MTTDIDPLLFQRSGSVRKAACVHLFASGGRSLTRAHTQSACARVLWWDTDMFGIPHAASQGR